MDNRLFKIWGLRPVSLRREDLPEVARGIVCLYRGKAKVTIGTTKNVPYVLISGRGLKVQILADDWAKITPYIQDGSFDQMILVTEQHNVYVDPNTAYDPSLIDRTDMPYYLYVLGILQGIFSESFEK